MVTWFIIMMPTACKKKSESEDISPKSGAEAEIKPDTKPEESVSDKWQQMLATDMESLKQDTGQKSRAVYAVSFHPQGQTRRIAEVDEINITFSQPVVALQKVSKGRPSLILVEPTLKGEGFWKSSNTYCYRIDEPLKYSTRYQVQFTGTTSIDGGKVEAKKWSFITPTIRIIKSKPRHKATYQTLKQPFILHFSQDVNPHQLKTFIKLMAGGNEMETSIRYSTEAERKQLYYWTQRYQKELARFITITPTTKYPMGTDVVLVLAKGLPSLEGNIGLNSERQIQIRTYEEFAVKRITPKFKPDVGIGFSFSNPVAINELVEKVQINPAVKLQNNRKWTSRDFNLNGNFRPGVTYRVKVPADLNDRYGNRLKESAQADCMALDYSTYFHPPGYQHYVLENYLEKAIPVSVRNLFEARIRYKSLSESDILKMFDKGRTRYLNVNGKGLDGLKDFIWKIPVKKNLGYVLGFKLDQIEAADPGAYYISFEYPLNSARPFRRRSVVQLTDTALVAKYSPSQVFVLPFNMKTGEAVPGMEFEIYGHNPNMTKAHKLGEFSGNQQGVAIYQPSMKELQKYTMRQSVVFAGHQKGFIWGGKPDMFDMWEYRYDRNLNTNYNPSVFYNHLLVFTDKHLYKGGQNVKVKGIIRQVLHGDMRIPELIKIEGKVFNSRNQQIHTFTLKDSDYSDLGSFATAFDLPENSPTGFYRIVMKAHLQESIVNRSLSFSVEEYKPAKFEVKVALDKSQMIAGEPFSGSVSGRYLFGTPMVQATGNCTWTLNSTYYKPSGWPGYTFGTYESHYRKTIYSKAITLDQEGVFQFNKSSLTVPGKNSAILTVHGEIKDKDNNRLSGMKSITLHKGQYYIGVRTAKYFFQQDKPGAIQFVTVNPVGKKFTNTSLDLTITREDWKSFQKKDYSGVLRWEWKKITEDILSEKLVLPEGELRKEYSFKKPGYYKIHLEGKDKHDNTITTSGHFYVTGSGYVSWGVKEGRIIDLVTDKKEYKVGDNIQLLIKSPFEKATALVTVEREKVIWSQVVTLKGNASAVPIPVQEDYMPNAFINVIILKERQGLKWDDEGNDIGKPEFYSGYTEIMVDTRAKKIGLKIRKDKDSYEPGEKVSLTITTLDHAGKPLSSEVCLSVVDKGVLNLVGYELPDPYEFFWRKRALDVKTVSTLNDVLGRRKYQEKGEDPGGDGGLSPFGSVVVRKNFKESAFYNAFVKTDEKGEATINFQLPDNLTTFKAMAVAVAAKNTFGKGNLDILVKKNIILTPALPDFIRPGDRFDGGVTVTNNSDGELSVRVDVEAAGVEREETGDAIKTLHLKPGETQPAWFRFNKTTEGDMRFVFKAVAGSFQDGLEAVVPMRLPRVREAVATSGRIEKKPVNEQVIVPDNTLHTKDSIEVGLASSAMVGVKRNFDILQEFPYDCLEQRISKQYPLLASGSFLRTYGLLTMDESTIKKRIKALLKQMPKYQKSSGGFVYYPDSIYPSEYLSCYATEFLMDAKRQGFDVDQGIMVKAKRYLQRIAKKTINSYYPYSNNLYFLLQSYAVYVLSKDGVMMNDVINNLFEVRDRIPFSGLAYLLTALNTKNDLPGYMPAVLTKTLLNKMKVEPTACHFENHEDKYWWCVHGSNVKTTAVVLKALLDVYQKFPYAEKMARWLTTTTRQKRWLSTQEHIRLFMAFTKYYQTFEKETPDFIAEVLMNKKVTIRQPFRGREMASKITELTLKDYQPGDKINITLKKEGKGIAYYILRMKYYPIGREEALNRGFDIKKTIKNIDGSPVEGAAYRAGEKYIVEVTVTNKQERSFVILDDPLPAGFKVLNPRFNVTSQLDRSATSRDSRWRGYWGRFYRSEYYFDHVEVFADYLRRGTHVWRYLVIATNGGSFYAPATMVLEMYNPEVFGRYEDRTTQIK